MNVLRALAVGFGLSEDYFTQYHGKADNQLRLLHYPRYQNVSLFLGDTFISPVITKQRPRRGDTE
jgi:isopenicillin N synthase-like dioxygenase